MVGTEGGASRAQLEADLVGGESPKEVLQAAGRWLAARLDGGRFVWRSSGARLEATSGGRSEWIGFESNRHNRAGRFIRIHAAWLRVYDKDLGQWRRRHPELTVTRPTASIDIVCSASYLDRSRAITILTDPPERVAALEALAVELETIALPWFETTREPATLAGVVPESLLRPYAFGQDLLEFLVSRDLPDRAAALIGRFISLSPEHEAAFADGRELARAGGRPEWHTPPAFGWSSHILGLA